VPPFQCGAVEFANNDRTKFMKFTKPLIIAALAVGNLLAWTLVLQGQDATNTPPHAPPAGGPPPGSALGGPGMRGRPNFDLMAQQLNLTDDQRPKFVSIMETRMQKMRDLPREPGFASMSPEERGAKMRSIQNEMETKMRDLLTPEQFQKWQRMPQMGMRGRRMDPPSGVRNAGNTNAPAPPTAKPPQ
jgi:Spy/CpxP family protein refolding chaperone